MSVSKAAPAAAAGVLIAVAVMAAPEARAQSAAEKGLAISVEADKRDLGFGDFKADGEMVLKDKGGRESRRVFRSMTMERPAADKGDLGVIVFEKPRDIRGTALLTHANIEPNDDDQWLYLPAIKRVKRISSSSRTGKFVSSEFSYEDLGSQEVNDYTYKWLKDEACPNQPKLTCFVVESKPKNPKSGYSRRVAWIDKGEYRLQHIKFYNRRGSHEKSLTMHSYKKYKGKFWRPGRMEMVNKQNGKATDLIWRNYKFGTGLEENDFRSSRLKRLAR